MLRNLRDHRGLGIHSEMLSDGIVDLIEMGIVTNEFKATDTGKTIGGFAFGSSRLYKFIEMNPAIELRNIEYGARTRAQLFMQENEQIH